MINLVLSAKLKKEETEKLIKNLKGGANPMLAVLDMIEKENKRIFRNGKMAGKKEGKKEGRLEMAKKMIEKRIDIKTIVEVTGLTEKEVKKLANL